jgi:hypothetical protein
MASNIDALRIRRALGSSDWLPPMPYGPDGWAFQHRQEPSSVLVSCDVMGDGAVWVHASMTRDGEVPSYGDLKLLHRAVFGDGWSYQVFTPPSDHVNIHEFALHLFGRLDGEPALPDFTQGSGSI